MTYKDKEELKEVISEVLSDFFDWNRTVKKAEAARILNRTRSAIDKMVKTGKLVEESNGEIKRVSVIKAKYPKVKI